MGLILIKWFLVPVLMVYQAQEIRGHGMLMVPVNRGSMWRSGYDTPINYDDNANFCGGYGLQWGIHRGKCGPCGDSYSLSRPRPNENTGTYGKGVIAATYEEGSFIDLKVRITANHWGYFLFELCPLNSSDELETEECFMKNPLKLEDGSDKYILPSSNVGLYSMTVKLPANLTCDQCVLRWHYTCGNNWGVCADGTGRLGCGPQETFRTCSDIAIVGAS